MFKACNVDVAASGVFFYARKVVVGFQGRPERPGKALIPFDIFGGVVKKWGVVKSLFSLISRG